MHYPDQKPTIARNVICNSITVGTVNESGNNLNSFVLSNGTNGDGSGGSSSSISSNRSSSSSYSSSSSSSSNSNSNTILSHYM